jgi:uncharacterized DUF497 family protein
VGKTVVSDDGRFEWDEEKNALNIKKHGFSFDEILEVFDDPRLFEKYDKANSTLEEDRWIGMGQIRGVLFLFICYTERNGRTRIYSARTMEPCEEKEYEKHVKAFIR